MTLVIESELEFQFSRIVRDRAVQSNRAEFVDILNALNHALAAYCEIEFMNS